MMQRSVAHTHSLFVKEPPKYLLDPSAPFVDGKEDSEIDFSVSTAASTFSLCQSRCVYCRNVP